MITYIVESKRRAEKLKDHQLFGHILVKIEGDLSGSADVGTVLKTIEKRLPGRLFGEVDAIYIGNFKPLNDRQVDSLYISGSILVGPNHEDNSALFNTLVHELAHAAEEVAGQFIYGDNSVQVEFLGKRKNLYQMLKDDYKLDKKMFMNPQFDQRFDNFLNSEIGYDNLGVMTSNLFISPYGCTSLREYFANGFEHYFIEGPKFIQDISPALYRKIVEILKKKDL
jgi:hypothetical protein